MINFIKQTLFRLLGLNGYLALMQKSYLAAYKGGLLKNNKTYAWHHFVLRLIRPGDTIIDIGANLGYFTSIFIKCLNSSGRLYSVEPVEAYRKQLAKITAGHSNVTILPFALGNENRDSVTLGMPSAFEKLGYLKHGVVTVETDERSVAHNITFCSPLKKASEAFAGLEKIDYIKCDIEGYETVVLQEMRELLLQHEPLVQLETWGEQLTVMLNFFKSIGFEAYSLEKDKLINCSKLQLHEINTSDVLFAPPSKQDRIAPYLA
ncbi:FkbM family methyltransferase [Foetidibacter luteolus]|uniref:FkbM family methyltransferase n=1 Tax=Foetidibacter luteolus TaxID=2608880 RepID=UPI00129AEA39|nr:FkbM family methyltransferase [Foetidibacter luteolus]